MEFQEKLQALRKSRGLTQEELAEALFVSRTAVSKWESGRGYPGIDSLKALSGYFAVSIDTLLSAQQLILLAENENRANLRRVCDGLSGLMDLFSLMLILLPLYPKPIDGYICAVALPAYTSADVRLRGVYWLLYLTLTAVGAVKIGMLCLGWRRGSRLLTALSFGCSIFAVLFLAMAREPYATAVVFLLLLAKAGLQYQQAKAG